MCGRCGINESTADDGVKSYHKMAMVAYERARKDILIAIKNIYTL